MHRSAGRDPLALMITAMLLGAVAGMSVGLLQGAGPGPTAAPTRAAAAAPSSSTHAAAAPHLASSSSRSGGPPQQRLSAPRRQLDRVKAATPEHPEHKESGGSGKRRHDDGQGEDNGKGTRSHDD